MQTLKKYLSSIAIMSMLFATSALHAEDIDIYDASAGSASNPNILLILDNSSNWSAANQGWATDTNPPVNCGNDCNKQGYYELKAIRTLISSLAANYGDSNGNVPINVGLQMFTKTNASPAGAYIRSAVVPMTAANRTALISKLDTIIGNFNTETASSSLQYSIALWDAFKYYGGYTNPANATADSTPAGVTTSSPSYSGVPLFGIKYWGSPLSNSYDANAYNGNNFNPVNTTSCGRNYIIFIGNGFPASESNNENIQTILGTLINPTTTSPSVAQFPLTTYSAGTTCTDVSTSVTISGTTYNTGGGTCFRNNNTPSCSDILSQATSTGLITNSTSTMYTCNACSGSTSKLQSCNIVTTTAAPSGNATNRYADEFTDFLYKTDVSSQTGQQNITTYTIDVYKNQQDLNQTALMMNMAKYGGGKYYAASDLTQLGKAFDSIFAEIQSVNSVFASSSLPVSVNAQGTYLNQVFMGMFRPDTTGAPRWFGNLKQYQFSIFGSNLRLADFDATPKEAISASTGFITDCAISAWTTDTANYWQYNPNSAGICNAATKFSDAPDGAVVEKGGAAQRLRGVSGTTTSTQYSNRALKTCNASNCNSLTNFDTSNSNVTASLSTDLINWVRGQDVDNENNTSTYPNTVTNEVRPSVHGGVVHSQPAVVDYGGTTGVVSFYGADDGVFHALNGNKASTDGNELWGFIAPESYSRLSRLKTNAPVIKYPSFSSTISPTPLPKDYFFDGSTGVFQSSGRVWIYPTMRRGGRAIYAFDVSTPSAPSLKWRAGCYTNDTTTDSSCAGGWAAIGQTWSKPQVAYLNGYVDGSNNPKPVLVFGGGYDTCEDTDSQTRCTSAPRKGANIWFVDADTGTLIRTYPTNYSVPGDITLIKDLSGNVTYAYAADTGGYVYRINVGTYNGTTFGSSWTSNSSAANITIASLSETNQARKFFFGPDVVVYPGFNTINIGSGDREHPLVSNYACNNFAGSSIKNQFYILKDRPPAYPSSVITPSSLTDVTTNLAVSASGIGSNGLFFNLVDPSNSGTLRCEQAVNKALTIGGVVYFGSNAPKSSTDVSSTCGINLGNARGYAVDFLTGAPVSGNSRSVVYPAGGLPPSPVAGVVDINGSKQPFCIGCTNPTDTNPSPLQGTKININPVGPRQRLYWYLNED